MMLSAFIMTGKRLEDTVGELVKVRINPRYFHEIAKFIPYSHGDPIGRWSVFEAREYCDGWFLYGKVFHKKVFDIVEEEADMARDNITDKSSPPKSEWFGFKYRVNPETSKLLQEAVFKDGGRWGGAAGTTISYLTDMYLEVKEDGNIWRPVTDTYFSASNLPEKQPPQAKKDFVVGKWYRCICDGAEAVIGTYYKVDRVDIRGDMLYIHDTQGRVISGIFTKRFDINSESDYNPMPVKANPAGYTAYVVFKQDASGFGRNTYNGKEYAYKCSRDDYTQWVEYRAFDEGVFAEVNVSGVEKKVKVVRIEAKVDPKATKSIVRILPKELAKDVEGSKLGTPKAILEAVNFVHDFKPNDFSITKEDVIMSNQNRVVSVKFFDDDAGLKAEHSLVAEYQVTTRVSDQMTISKVLLTEDVAGDIELHNGIRANTVDLHILKQTGNKVMLQPVEFEDLRVEVRQV